MLLILVIIAIIGLPHLLRLLVAIAAALAMALGIIFAVALAIVAYQHVGHALGQAGATFHAHPFEALLHAIAIVAWTAALAWGAIVIARGLRRLSNAWQARRAQIEARGRLQRSLAVLRRARRSVTATSLAHAAGVDRETALAFITRDPRRMPAL